VYGGFSRIFGVKRNFVVPQMFGDGRKVGFPAFQNGVPFRQLTSDVFRYPFQSGLFFLPFAFVQRHPTLPLQVLKIVSQKQPSNNG